MPLRTCLWLLVPAAIGVTLGLKLAVDPAATVAPSASAKRASAPTLLPSRRVYRRARLHAALPAPAGTTPTVRPGLVPLSPVAVSATLEPSDEVVAFASSDRAFSSETAAPLDAPAPATEAATTSATPVNTTPIAISDVRTVSLSATGATVAWRTSEPVTGRVSYGLDGPTLWSGADAGGVDHVAAVDGLTFGTSYRLWVQARSTDGRSASLPFLLTTPGLPAQVTATADRGAFAVAGNTFFPTMVWGACRESHENVLAAGIDLFMGAHCPAPAQEAASLAGRALFLDDARAPAVPGAVGSYLPDEWDTHLPGNLTATTAERLIPRRTGVRFLTLTNHFYSRAEPLPQGRGMYPALVPTADVIGFDLYPLQNWCRSDTIGDVFDSQRELGRLAAGRPTFQWIEARRMDCSGATLDPTPQTVRAETWLAIAGGAHAIGYFPYDWSAAVGAEISRSKREIQMLVPALVEPPVAADAGGGAVRVGARVHNGAVYVIAVNPSQLPQTATINVPAAADRTLTSLDGTRSVTAAAGRFSDTFAPLDVHVYLAAPTS